MPKRAILRAIVIFILLCMPAVVCAKTVLNKNKYFPDSRVEYINLDWWKCFNDELLIEYILKALEVNHDIKIARLKACELKQEMNKNISNEFPRVSVGADYLGLKIPRTIFPLEGFRNNAFALPFIASWEADLFGKTFNKIQMAKEEFKASIWDEKGICLSIVSDVASIYFNIANLNEQINIQKNIIEIKADRVRRYEKKFNYGTAGAIELNTVKNELDYEKTVLAEYLKQREEYKTHLASLISTNPLDTSDIVVENIKNIEFKGIIPDCINGEIVINRPDLMKLESNIKKARIDVRLARKAFLPNVNITGILLFSTLTPNFGWDGAVANLLAGGSESLFEGGRRIFNIKQKKIEYERALEEYLKADINALKEVNDAMYNLKTDIITYETNLRRLSFQENNFIRVSNSFVSGTKNHIDYTDEKNTFLLNKSRVFNSKTQKLVDLVSLYKSTGGAL